MFGEYLLYEFQFWNSTWNPPMTVFSHQIVYALHAASLSPGAPTNSSRLLVIVIYWLLLLFPLYRTSDRLRLLLGYTTRHWFADTVMSWISATSPWPSMSRCVPAVSPHCSGPNRESIFWQLADPSQKWSIQTQRHLIRTENRQNDDQAKERGEKRQSQHLIREFRNNHTCSTHIVSIELCMERKPDFRLWRRFMLGLWNSGDGLVNKKCQCYHFQKMHPVAAFLDSTWLSLEEIWLRHESWFRPH